MFNTLVTVKLTNLVKLKKKKETPFTERDTKKNCVHQKKCFDTFDRKRAKSSTVQIESCCIKKDCRAFAETNKN